MKSKMLASPWLLLTLLAVGIGLSAVVLTWHDSSGSSSSNVNRDKPALLVQGQLQAAAAIPGIPTGTDVAVSPTSTDVSGTAITTVTVTSTPTNVSASA